MKYASSAALLWSVWLVSIPQMRPAAGFAPCCPSPLPSHSLFLAKIGARREAVGGHRRRFRVGELFGGTHGNMQQGFRLSMMCPMPLDKLDRRGLKASTAGSAEVPWRSGEHKYFCTLCNCGLLRKKNWDQHLAGKQHNANAAAADDTLRRFAQCAEAWQTGADISKDDVFDESKDGAKQQHLGVDICTDTDTISVGGEVLSKMDVVKAWNADELMGFRMRQSCLSPSDTFFDLNLYNKARMWKYVSELMPYYPELPMIVLGEMSREGAQYLRVKEIFESFETFKCVENFLVGAGKWREITKVYDAACGHGLVGILLAYRFPSMHVVGVDIAARPALNEWVRAWQALGDKMPQWKAPLENYRFRQGSVGDLGGVDLQLDHGSCVVAVHGCNEVNSEAVEAARSAGALWAAMPCCVPEGLYMGGCALSLQDKPGLLNERHVFMCGAMANRYQAQQVARIDERITNRNILIAGGCSELPPAEKLVGFTRKVLKVASAYFL